MIPFNWERIVIPADTRETASPPLLKKLEKMICNERLGRPGTEEAQA